MKPDPVHDTFAQPPALTPAGERLVAAAGELFYHRGIRAIGVDTIAEAAGTTKKTLYDCFGSKDALVAAYLVRRARNWQAFLGAELDRHPDGVARVLSVFDAVERWTAGATRGCAFFNAYAELADARAAPHPAVPIVRAEKTWMRACFVDLVGRAGVADPERVAHSIHLLYEGALVTSTAGADPSALTDARDAAAGLLRTAGAAA